MSSNGLLSLLLTDASLLFAQADIGVKNGHIKAIGKAGNPDVMDGVDLDMIVGVNTEVRPVVRFF